MSVCIAEEKNVHSTRLYTEKAESIHSSLPFQSYQQNPSACTYTPCAPLPLCTALSLLILAAAVLTVAFSPGGPHTAMPVSPVARVKAFLIRSSMGGRPELKKGARGEEMLLVLVGCLSLLLLLLLQQVFGGGISVVIVGMVILVGFSLRVEAYGKALEIFFLPGSVVLASLVAGRRDLRAQQHGPRALSHWHPVFSVVMSDASVKAPSQVTNILISTSTPEARSCAEALDSSSENQ